MRQFALVILLAAPLGCAAPTPDRNGTQAPGKRPQVVGTWTGTWGVAGAPADKRQALDCKVVALNPESWEATFEGECGRPYKYTIKMLGRQEGDVVLFRGTVDLGPKDGGVYDWIGKATEKKFVGFYTSPKYTGSFELAR